MKLKLLFNYPTMTRPEWFKNTIGEYLKKIKDIANCIFLIKINEDDYTMNNHTMLNFIKKIPNVHLEKISAKSKIEAINASIDNIKDWDIMVNIADDLIPNIEGFDEIIRNKANKIDRYGDFVLFFQDIKQQLNINTYPIIGRIFYERFGYVYHHSYLSVFCDNELTQVADMLGKQYRFEQMLLKHENAAITGKHQDDLHLRNERKDYYHHDSTIYNYRKEHNFFIKSEVKSNAINVIIISQNKTTAFKKTYESIVSLNYDKIMIHSIHPSKHDFDFVGVNHLSACFKQFSDIFNILAKFHFEGWVIFVEEGNLVPYYDYNQINQKLNDACNSFIKFNNSTVIIFNAKYLNHLAYNLDIHNLSTLKSLVADVFRPIQI